MKCLIALLLIWPAFAGAQQSLYATSGSLVMTPGDPATFTVQGADFSFAGTTDFGGSNPLQAPFSTGPLYLQWSDGTSEYLLADGMTVNGRTYSSPQGTCCDGSAGIEFDVGRGIDITSPGVYTGAFTFGGSYLGNQTGLGCNVSLCSDFWIFGSGSVTVDVSGPYVGTPGALQISKVTYTFEPVPEPATLSLMAAGLALIGFRAYGRRRRRLVLLRRLHWGRISSSPL